MWSVVLITARGRDCEKCCFFRTRASWLCVNFSSMTKLTNEVVHISVTVWARAKRRTVQSSPRGRDCEKCCFFRTRASWLCVNFSTFSIQSVRQNWQMKWCISQYPCELELNGVQFRVHHEVEIVKNIVSFTHAQVDFALILAPSAYNQYDQIDKWSGAYLSNRVS